MTPMTMTADALNRRAQPHAVRRLRLINFHNFADEIIEIKDGGHLFLLGDNGSGKTTVLDALHYALSGGVGMELNAAARVGGRRDEGRTLQGIVLRFDAERGVLNDGGAICYAVVETVAESGETICFGVGTEATTLEGRITRWGILTRRTLEELPLLDANLAPATREDLRQALGRDAFGRIEDYRKAVAERFFGGPGLYDEVCGCWSMAKCYREIVANSRDFGTLFGRLLPAPNAQVFGDILRSLREIDDLGVSLNEIEAQRSYVAGLVERTEEVARRREAAARYRWLVLHRRLDACQRAHGEAAARRERQEIERYEAEARVAAAEGRVTASEAALATAGSGQGADLIAQLRTAEAAVAERRGEARAALADAQAAQRRRRVASEGAAVAADELAQALQAAARGLEAAIDASAPAELFCARRVARQRMAWAEAIGAGSTLPVDPGREPGREPERTDPEACAEVTAAVRAAQLEAEACRREVRDRNQAVDVARERLSELAERREETPTLSGFADALRNVATLGLSATPLYELLEPVPDASPTDLAAIEALVGEETLAALVTSSDQVDAVRESVLRKAPGIRVVVRTAEDTRLPGWAQALFQSPAGPTAWAAQQALAAALAQPPSFGEVGRPAVGIVDLRGAAWWTPRTEPRLLGADARKRAHAARLRKAQAALDEAEKAVAIAAEAEGTARAVVLRLEATARALEALDGPALARLHHAALRCEQEHRHAAELGEQARRRGEEMERRQLEAESLLAALRGRVDPDELAQVERRLAELRKALDQARAALRRELERVALLGREIADAESMMSQRQSESEALAVALADAAGLLRCHMAEPLDGPALERYVRVTQRGDQFQSIEAIEDRIRQEERAEQSATDELEGDGSRGVRWLSYAGQFGFAYDRSQNRVEDRRGQPAPGILAQLDRDLAEQREVVGEKTRNLMDTLVMGTLARHLQERVEQLNRTVRDINRLLDGLRFGCTQYQFVITPQPDRRELVELVRSIAILNEESRREFRAWIDEKLPDLKIADDGGVPELLDYRRWFEYRLKMRSDGAEGVELTRELRTLGSGGEQGVPNYLLVLAMAKLMFDNAGARVRPILLDEAFYGIDAGRRDQLLKFATDLGLQLFVASPDQDGVTSAVKRATTLFVVKDEHCDVHLAPYHYWNLASVPQASLFPGPQEPPANGAECRHS